MAYRIAYTAPLTEITDVGCTNPLLDHHFGQLSDEELGKVVRDRVETLYHPFGTCTMGNADNPLAVLDTQLRVRGVLGLRVCDASVYPKLVSGHTVSVSVVVCDDADACVTRPRLSSPLQKSWQICSKQNTPLFDVST